MGYDAIQIAWKGKIKICKTSEDNFESNQGPPANETGVVTTTQQTLI
jgi:hypothetical protein